MRWKFGPKTPGICHLNDWPDVFWMPHFYSCIRTYHDDAEVWTFTQKTNMNFANNIKVSFEKYPPDPDPMDSAGYQLPCRGDSGGGHWMPGEWVSMVSGTRRQVLIGVSVSGYKQCGKSAYMENLNSKEALRWIKSHYRE